MLLDNPFDKYEADDYDIENVYEMFVDDESIMDKFSQPRHHFIWGSRGSGKSMLLRSFEPYCQFKKFNGWEKYFENKSAFIGVYCPIPRGLITEKKFENIDPFMADILSSHLFNILVAENILKTTIKQLSCVNLDTEIRIRFVDRFIQMISPKDEHIQEVDSCNIDRKKDSLNWVYEFINQEMRRIVKYIQFAPITNEFYSGCLTDYHDFILPLVKALKDLLSFSNSFYIMFDDAGFLSENIQKKINTWISNRNHKDINIKVASEQLNYKSFLTNDGRIIERINDFEDIYLDWKEISIDRNFERNAKKIAEKRLSMFSMGTTDVEVLFPENKDQSAILCEMRKLAEDRLDLPENSHIKDKARYINRISFYLFHKELNRRRLTRNYAGYKNIINLSFGNIRSYLRLSRFIIDAAKLQDGIEKIRSQGYSVKSTIQNKAITDFALREFEDIKSYKPGEDDKVFDALNTLIKSMCELFTYRLKTLPLVESAITSFALRNPEKMDDFSKKVIRTALSYRYLIRKSYKAKDGLGREDVYVINKVLFPSFGLEPTPFSGRIIITNEAFQASYQDPQKFKAMSKMMDEIPDENKHDQLTMFDNCYRKSCDLEVEQDEYDENDLSGLY